MDVLGERLREQRIKQGRTQQWIANRLMIDRTTYTKYERGQVEPPLENLCRLATLLDCSVDWLLGRE